MFVTIDKNADVCNLFEDKPIRNKNHWESSRRNCDNFQVGYLGCIPKYMFPYLKWEDEPIEVELIIKNE